MEAFEFLHVAGNDTIGTGLKKRCFVCCGVVVKDHSGLFVVSMGFPVFENVMNAKDFR